MAVVVVLPCVPATAIPTCPSIIWPRNWGRFNTGMPAARLASISTLSGGTADETTTNSAPVTFSARCPAKTRAPSRASASATGESTRSEPETSTPCSSSTRAMAESPAPPMPTK